MYKKGGIKLPNQSPLIMQGCLSGKWYVVTKYKQLGGDKVQSLEKFDVTDRILEIITEAGIETKRLHEALTKAAEDTAKLRQGLVDQERINEELEQELAILKHQIKPDKITFNPQFEKLTKGDTLELHRIMTGEADRENERKEKTG
jgi:hypothetical protein